MMDMIAQKRGPVTIGIDVSKAVPDVHLHPEGLRHRFANDSAGHAAWTDRAAPHQPERVIFEPTGACHRALATALRMPLPPGMTRSRWKSELHPIETAQSGAVFVIGIKPGKDAIPPTIA